MNKVRRRKYKIYKKLKTDLWGDLLVRYKRNGLTSLILNEFEFNLNKIKKKFLKKFKLKFNLKKNNFINLKKNKLFTDLNKTIIKSSSINNLLNLFKTSKFLTERFQQLWDIRRKQHNKLKWNVLKILRRKYKNKKIELSSSFNKKFKLKRYREDNSIFSKSLNLKKFTKMKKIKNLIRMKLLEKKLALFYGFKNTKKFKFFQDTAFYLNNLRVLVIFKLEAKLTTIAFRLNMSPNCYWTKSMIRKGFFELNNILVKNVDIQVKLFDDISVSIYKYKEILLVFWGHLLKKTFYLNVPNYIEFNQNILYASLWRLPLKNEILGPYTFPFGKSPYNWSMSSIPFRY